MKQFMKKKYAKPIIFGFIGLIILIFVILIYNNVFAGVKDNRLEGIENYKLTENEKNKVIDAFKEINEVEKVTVHIDNKIIKIIVTLNGEADFEKVKEVANNSITKFSEDNLSFYDLEVYVKPSSDESETYPQIGYKNKNATEFSW